MRFLVFLITAICLLIVSNTFAQDVAVFYDAAVEGGRGLAVNNPAQLADMMVKELKELKHHFNHLLILPWILFGLILDQAKPHDHHKKYYIFYKVAICYP